MKKVLLMILITILVTVSAICLAACDFFNSCSSCSSCNNNQGEQDSEELPHIHQYGEWQIFTAPTCTVAGEKRQACSCGDYKTETIQPLGHDWDEGKVTNAATCTVNGEILFTCSRDNSHTKTETILAAHDIVVDEAIPATCTSMGLTVGSHCSICNSVIIEQTEIPKLNHSWNSGVIIREATCSAVGIKKYSCISCGETKTEDIDKVSHTIVTDEAITATCTSAGVTEGSHCSVCGIILLKQQVIEELGHDLSYYDAQEATCTESGWKPYSICSRCDFSTYEELPATGHAYSNDWTYDNYEHWHTATCGHVTQINGKNEHCWDNGVIQAASDCSETNTVYTCTVCCATKTETGTSHNYEVIETVNATCTQDGCQKSECSICSDIKIVIIPSLGHFVKEYTVVIEPTCTENGEGIGICEVCNEEITHIIVAEGHTSSELIYEAEEYCGEHKIGHIYCLKCNEVLIEYGHNYKTTVTQPTCTKDGKINYACTNCGDSNDVTVEKNDHLESDWTTIKQATCSEEGQEELLCKLCFGQIATRNIPKVDHIYESEQEENVITYTCKYCDDTYSVEANEGSCQISYVTNCETEYAPLSIAMGEVAPLPELELDGYEFLGWYLDEELTNYYLHTRIYEDTTLYALWTKSELSASTSDAAIVTDVSTSFTFTVISNDKLTNSNLKNYVQVTDISGNRIKVSINEIEGNNYVIGSTEYKPASKYTVIVANGVKIDGVEGNEMWIFTHGENFANIRFKDNVVRISETWVYGVEENDGLYYLLLKKDLLNIGDIAVVYGEDEYDILMSVSVTAEGKADNLYIYQVVVADGENVFTECEIYNSTEIDMSGMIIESNFEEESIEALESSPLYAQFKAAAYAFSGIEVGDYYYDYNGIDIKKPKLSFNGGKAFLEFRITAEFARMHTTTHKIDGLLYISFNIGTELSLSTDCYFKSFNDYSAVLAVKNTTYTNLTVSLSKPKDKPNQTPKTFKEELNYFKELLRAKKVEGKLLAVENSSAKKTKDLTLGQISIWFYGIKFSFRISNVFSFDVVGELGVNAEFSSTVRLGFENPHQSGFRFVGSYKSEGHISAYLYGKINVSDSIKVEASLSILGIVSGYINASLGGYFEVAGMIEASIATGGGMNAVAGGYLKLGIKIQSSAGVSVQIPVLWWKVTLYNKSWTIFNKNFPLLSLGGNELPLYFEKNNESYELTLSCNGSVNLSTIIDRSIFIQNLTDMKRSNKIVVCTYYLDAPEKNISLKNGTLTLSKLPQKVYSIKVKVCYGNIYKYVTINLTLQHNSINVSALAPGCTTEGHTSGTKCSRCNLILSGVESIRATGHTSVVDEAVDPTCTASGKSDGSHCSVCNKILVAQTTIPQLGHDLEQHGAKPSTCTEKGWYEYDTCSRCAYSNFKEAPLAPHSYGDWQRTEETHSHTCILCSHEETSNHNYAGIECSSCGYLKPTEGLAYSLNADKSSYTVTGIDSATENIIIIPEKYNGLPVTAIGNSAFYKRNSLTRIIIPDGVTSIANFAFEGCSGLTSIKIPNAVANIYYWAFKDCSSLTIYCETASKPSGWASDWNYSGCPVVWDCKNNNKDKNGYEYAVLDGIRYRFNDRMATVIKQPSNIKSNIAIPANVTYKSQTYSVTSIGPSAFNRCSSLTSITVPNGVTNIGNGAFYNCSSLTSITIPNSVTIIDDFAFSGCSSITSITIPTGVTNIGNFVFENCSILRSIIIPDSVTSIGYYHAFSGCSELASITVLEGNIKYHSTGNCLIETAKKALIAGCKNSIIPTDGSVTSIGDVAFHNCFSLTSFTIPDCVTDIGSSAFSGCTSLTSIIIGNSVRNIGYEAFSGCSELTSITIPNSVTLIISSAFSGCSGLTSITVAEGNTEYHSTGNCLIETAKKALIAGCKNSVIPTDGSVTSISSSAFYNCRELTSLNIPVGVTSIGSSAFYGCSELTRIYYKGTAQDWVSITIGSSNSELTSATRYYYSETEPELNAEGTAYDGNYWHYVDNEIVVWKKEN